MYIYILSNISSSDTDFSLTDTSSTGSLLNRLQIEHDVIEVSHRTLQKGMFSVDLVGIFFNDLSKYGGY